MPQFDSLDDLIAKKAFEYADQIKAAAAMADKEEEIRIESEKQLAFIQKVAGIKLEGKHEFTVASGRVDSVYSRVIIEYKNPKSGGDKIGPKGDSPGSKKVVEQIKKRFYDMRAEHGQPLNSLFGVGLDGNYFIFVRFRDEKWQVQEPVEVNHVSAERFLWALFNLGQKGKAFSPEYLAGDFGSEGGNTIAINGIHALYNAIVTTDNPKAQTFFSQWKILFGEVCGYDVDSYSEKLKKLGEFYQVDVEDLKPAELLFAVHTYYALFMKLLAAEIVSFFHNLPTPLEKMMQATTSNKLKREMEDLEAGSIFRHLNITNFLEGDLFAWYTSVWTEPIEKLVREMVIRLDDYNPGTLSEDPSGSRDLLKKLYQQLFPKSVRHDLGEYYTPDWLAEHVLDEIGYAGDPDKRLLDPACGSGTFLIMAINRIRRWYDENRESRRFDESELGRKILANVIGFDLNPLAVMASRTNYLIAIRDLIGHIDKVEIPVYLCDSIMTPSEYGGLFAGKLGISKELKTAPTTFIIPTEIATNREDVTKYAEQLEFCVRNSYSPSEFIQRCRDEGLPINEQKLHIALYNELVKLDKANKNGIWARIIKNAFAPLFTGQVDYIAGNPPWVNWEALPEDYRSQIAPLWLKYGIYSGIKKGKVITKDDICVLMTYCSVDNYLKIGGQLGFLLTQTLFKSKDAGEGFRHFSYQSDQNIIYLKLKRVWDFGPIQAFEGATNHTASLLCEKSTTPTNYPIPYSLISRLTSPSSDSSFPTFDLGSNAIVEELMASPIISEDKSSPWITVKKECLPGLQKALGKSGYRARVGVFSGGLNGCFWINILQDIPPKHFLIENLYDSGKKTVEHRTAKIEKDLIYPFVRSRDIKKWNLSPSAYLLLVNQTTKLAAIPEKVMKSQYPDTFAYLKTFEKQLLQRKGYTVKRLMETGPFYAISEVGPYTIAPIRVLWRQMLPQLRMAVALPINDKYLGNKVMVTQHVVTQVVLDTETEAFYFSALGNSSIASLINTSYSTAKSFGTPQLLDYLKIPHFIEKDRLHQEIAELGRKACEAAAASDRETVAQIEKDIDNTAAKLWGITSNELKPILDVVNQTLNLDRKSVDEQGGKDGSDE